MADRRTQVVRFTIGALAAALVMVLIVAIVVAATKSSQIRETQTTNSPTLAAIKDLTSEVESCVKPGRPCYIRAKKNAANQVASVNQVVILAAACASGPARLSVQQIQACVIRRLAHQHP